jgi:uracil-DNA glycosylase
VFNGVAFGNGFPDKQPHKIQPSLRNIKKELERSYGSEINIDWSLYSWAKQGVLLLNTAHTVIQGNAGSHLDIWKPFTEEVFHALNTKDNIIWMLWGKSAQGYSSLISDKHHVIFSGHPSPLNRANPFVGSGCFKYCDDILKEDKISWIL